MRLINADEIHWAGLDDCHGKEYAKYLIDHLPDIIAEPVVRCKDCIHYGEVGDCEVHPHDGRFNVNYFCADGEKKS